MRFRSPASSWLLRVSVVCRDGRRARIVFDLRIGSRDPWQSPRRPPLCLCGHCPSWGSRAPTGAAAKPHGSRRLLSPRSPRLHVVVRREKRKAGIPENTAPGGRQKKPKGGEKNGRRQEIGGER